MRVLVFPEKRSGNCWTEISAPWEMAIDITWDSDRGEGNGSGLGDLKEKGWWPVYRSSGGFGTERRARFDALEVNLGTAFSCRCVEEAVQDEGTLEVTFRWKKGEMPETSGVVRKSGEREGIRPVSVYGHLLTWDFAGTGEFPVRTPARCGVHATVTVLNAPPIL